MNRATASPPASTRTRAAGARASGLAALAAVALSTWACTLSQNGVTPPSDTFFYPTSGVMSPTDPAGQWLYVANSNADLRFNDGTLVMVDVAAAYDDRHSTGQLAMWGACPQADYVNPLSRNLPQTCCWDLLDSNILNCDERQYIKPDATVLIGSFAALMVWQSYCDDPCLAYHATGNVPLACLADPTGGRLLIGVRGDTSLTYVDVVPTAAAPTGLHPAFRCTGDPTTPSMAECDQKVVDTSSSLAIESGDPQAPHTALPDEPYALALDKARGYLYVGHLVGSTSVQDTGGVSLFDVSGTGFITAGAFPPAPRFIAPFGSPFPPSSSGLFGVTALKLHEPLGVAPDDGNSELKQLFVSSRYVPLVTAMVPIGPSICAGDQNDDVLVPSGNTLNSNLVGSEVRGVEFLDPLPGSQPNYAQRAYALQRVPPDLVGFDIANNESGATIVTPTDVLETCSSPTFLYQHDTGAGEGPRLFVNCFDTGEVYVFDPSGPTLLTTFGVGRGPAGMVFDTARPLAYVIDFSQNDVSVVDLGAGSPTQYHVVQRLGFPSVTPR